MEPLEIKNKIMDHYQEFLNKSKPTDEFLAEQIIHVNISNQKIGETFVCYIDQSLHLLNEYRQCKECYVILCEKRCLQLNDCPKCRQKLEYRGFDLNLKNLLEDLEVDGCNFKECEESLEKRDKNKKYLIYSELIKHWKETCQYCEVVCSFGCLQNFNRITAKQHYKQCVKAKEQLKSIKTCKECGYKLKNIYDYICQACKIKRERENQIKDQEKVNEAISCSNLRICPVCKGMLLKAFKYECNTCRIRNQQLSPSKGRQIITKAIESPHKNEIQQNSLKEIIASPNNQMTRTQSRLILNFDYHKLEPGSQSPSKKKHDFDSLRNIDHAKMKLIKFGLENQNGHLSSSLNSCLQALWNLAPMQKDIKTFCEKQSLTELQVSNAQTQKLVQSIKDFYLRIINNKETIQFGHIILSSINIRKELFKTFYLTNQFNLNKKADANQVFDLILQVIHFTFTRSIEFKSLDLKDQDNNCNGCFVHLCFNQNISTLKKCECGRQFPQQIHTSNFKHIVDIEDLLVVINEHLGHDNPSSLNSPLKKIMNLLPMFFRKSFVLINSLYLQEKPQSICIDQDCKIKHTSMKISIQRPLPSILCFKLNYKNPELDPLSLLKIFVSIPDTFKISDLFDTIEKDIYQFKGMICAKDDHYSAYFRTLDQDLIHNPTNQQKSPYHQTFRIPGKDNGKWLLFDDTRVKEIIDWTSLVNDCVQALIKPTTLFFQNVPDIMKSKLEVQAIEKFNPTKLEMLNYDLLTIEKKARQQSEGLDHAQQIEMMRYFQQQQQQFQSDVGESNASFQPAPMNSATTDQSIPDSQPANKTQIKRDIKKCMQYLKEEYLKIGVYLFKCESCKQYMHLNQLFCPYKGCKVRNSFYDDTKVVDKDTNYSIMQSIFEVHANDDKRKEILTMIACKNDPEVTIETQSPSGEVPYLENKIDLVIPSQVKQEAPKKEFKENDGQENSALNKTIVEKQADQNYKLELNQGILGSSPYREKGSIVSQSVQNFTDFKVKSIDQKYNEIQKALQDLKKKIRNQNSNISDKNTEHADFYNQIDEEPKINSVESKLKDQNLTQSMSVKSIEKQNGIKELNDNEQNNLNFNKMSQQTMIGIHGHDDHKEESPRINVKGKQQQASHPHEYSKSYNFASRQKQSAQMQNIFDYQHQADQEKLMPQRGTYVPEAKGEDDEFVRESNENIESKKDEKASEEGNVSDDGQVLTDDVRASVQINQLQEQMIINNMAEIQNKNEAASGALKGIKQENHEQDKQESAREIIQESDPKRPFIDEEKQVDTQNQKTQQVVLEQQQFHQGDGDEEQISIEKDEDNQNCIVYQKMEYNADNDKVQDYMETSKAKQENMNDNFGMEPKQSENGQLTIPRGEEGEEEKEKQEDIIKKEKTVVDEYKKEIFDEIRIFGYGLQDLESSDFGRRNYLTSIASQCHDYEPKIILQQIIGEISKGINPVPYFQLLDNIILNVQGQYLELIKPQIVEIVQNFYYRNNKEDDNQVFYLIKGWQIILDNSQMVELFRIYNRDYKKYLDKKKEQFGTENGQDTLICFEPQCLPLSVFYEDKFVIGICIDREDFKQKYINRLNERFEEVEMRKKEKQRLNDKISMEEQNRKKENKPNPQGNNETLLERQLEEFKTQSLNLQGQNSNQDQSYLNKHQHQDKQNSGSRLNEHGKSQSQFTQSEQDNMARKEEQKETRKIKINSKQEEFHQEQNVEVNNKPKSNNVILRWKCPICSHINTSPSLCLGKLGKQWCSFNLQEYGGNIEFVEYKQQIEDQVMRNNQQQKSAKNDNNQSDRKVENLQSQDSDDIEENDQQQEEIKTDQIEQYSKIFKPNSTPYFQKVNVKQNQSQQKNINNNTYQVDLSSAKPPSSDKKQRDQQYQQIDNENTFICSKCNRLNEFNLKQVRSCICTFCYEANLTIYELIGASKCKQKQFKITQLMVGKNYIREYLIECIQCQNKKQFDIRRRRCTLCSFDLDYEEQQRNRCPVCWMQSEQGTCDMCAQKLQGVQFQKDYFADDQSHQNRQNINSINQNNREVRSSKSGVEIRIEPYTGSYNDRSDYNRDLDEPRVQQNNIRSSPQIGSLAYSNQAEQFHNNNKDMNIGKIGLDLAEKCIDGVKHFTKASIKSTTKVTKKITLLNNNKITEDCQICKKYKQQCEQCQQEESQHRYQQEDIDKSYQIMCKSCRQKTKFRRDEVDRYGKIKCKNCRCYNKVFS